MNESTRMVLGMVLATATSMVVAAEGLAEVPPPPPLVTEAAPAASDADNELTPQITITDKDDTTVEEYRIKGQLYMIKVIPKKGVPYYLVDSDGSGRMEKRVDDRSPRLLIPSWVILKFR